MQNLDDIRDMLDRSIGHKETKHKILVSALKELIRIIEQDGENASRDRKKLWLKTIHFIANDMA